MSASDELYRRGTSYQGEVADDRCAGRRVRAERAALAAGPLGPDEQDFVRRAAADIVSTMLVSHDAGSDRRPTFRVNDAYLPPPLRILALAGEIGAGAHGPTVCGGAAENLVEAAQQTFKAIPGNGLMPDEMEHAFPTGVIDAWNHRAHWSPSVFFCR